MTTKKIGKHNIVSDSNFRLFAMGVALLCLTLSAFVSTTLAWFDISDNLIVNNLSMSFDKDDYFKIGLKKDETIDYFQDLDSGTLESYSSYRHEDPLGTVTSAFQNEWLDNVLIRRASNPSFWRARPRKPWLRPASINSISISSAATMPTSIGSRHFLKCLERRKCENRGQEEPLFGRAQPDRALRSGEFL
jgi:hypothetical protein